MTISKSNMFRISKQVHFLFFLLKIFIYKNLLRISHQHIYVWYIWLWQISKLRFHINTFWYFYLILIWISRNFSVNLPVIINFKCCLQKCGRNNKRFLVIKRISKLGKGKAQHCSQDILNIFGGNLFESSCGYKHISQHI